MLVEHSVVKSGLARLVIFCLSGFDMQIVRDVLQCPIQDEDVRVS